MIDTASYLKSYRRSKGTEDLPMSLISIVKYDGDPDVFAWKYPDSELGAWTQVIVNESQQAIIFKGGQALEVLDAGRHTLETANIPLLEQIVNMPFGGRSPFAVEVWFVNKTFSLDVKWGTPTPIQIQDPAFKIFIPVRANGVFGMRIGDPRRFLIKLVGTLPSFTKKDIRDYFRGLYTARVKDAISTYMLERGIGILEINMHIDELSGFLQDRLAPEMAEYGVNLINFFINDISMPDNDPAAIQLRASLAKRAEMNIIGFDYIQERSFDTLEGAATNPGSAAADTMGAGLGMGMGIGVGTGLSGAFAQIAQGLTITSSNESTTAGMVCAGCGALVPARHRFCGICGNEIVASRFCAKCGAELAPSALFCHACGTAIGRPIPQSEASEQKGGS